MLVTIGALTYNDTKYSLNWIDSVKRNIPDRLKNDVRIILVDNGTPNCELVENLDKECALRDVDLIHHCNNRGIAAGWNTIARAYPETDIICIFNNDVQVTSPDTFTCAIYFIEHNLQVGASYWPTVYVYSNGTKSNWWTDGYFPCIARQPAGYAFFIRREAYNKARDFWEERCIDGGDWNTGFELYRVGYEVIGMPYPSIEHWYGPKGLGHYTIDSNPELEKIHGNEPRIRRREGTFRWPASDEQGCDALIAKYIQPYLDRQRKVRWLDADGKIKEKIIPEQLPGKLVTY